MEIILTAVALLDYIQFVLYLHTLHLSSQVGNLLIFLGRQFGKLLRF